MPLRGEVWWVRLDPTVGSEIAKTRPCLILSTNVVNERRRTVVVVPVSTSPTASPPLLVPIQVGEQTVVAVTDQIRAIAKERLKNRIAEISAGDMAAVESGVRRILDLG
jgi:mRNA interferase MazF